jgi:predicted RNA-binding protein YlxR (DUF448 family)
MRPKRELVRVVRTPAGEVRVDSTGKLAGRGAYVCPADGCVETALRERRLEHALEVPIPDPAAAQLRVAVSRGVELSRRT